VTLSFAITLALHYLLVVLFLPFSALDKILNFNGAVAQARETVPSDSAARLAIVAALSIEIIMPLGIVPGVADPARRPDHGGLLRDHGVALEAVLEAG
jgi:putative oxidoreductase